MAKRDGTLNRKERKRYSKLVGEKLESMGMTSETMFVPFKTRAGNSVTRKYVDAFGKVVFEGPVGKLSNPYRNLVKRLRRLPKSVIESFLSAQVGEQPKKEQT